MDGVKTRFFGTGVILMLAALMMLIFASAAQAQTPAEDQYGSPTGPPVAGGAQGGGASGVAGSAEGGSGATGSGSGGSGSAAPGDPSGATAGASAEETGGIVGGVLPSTGGAPIYLILSGAILLGTGATLWLRHRTES